MSDWLVAATEVLDRSVKPVRIFFRNDDAGWANDKLYWLLDEFAQSGTPIDVAVIPEALDQGLADELLSRWYQNQHLIGLHQHGFSHINHEPAGRKCEFGNARSKMEQKDTIQNGRERLKEAFGNALDPIFTPPWNRCTQITVECLEELDFRILSQDITAAKLDSPALRQVPVHIDWSRMMRQSPDSLNVLGQAIAIQLQKNDLTGIMLHHADIDETNWKPMAELLTLFSQHDNVQKMLIRNTCVGWIDKPGTQSMKPSIGS